MAELELALRTDLIPRQLTAATDLDGLDPGKWVFSLISVATALGLPVAQTGIVEATYQNADPTLRTWGIQEFTTNQDQPQRWVRTRRGAAWSDWVKLI